MFQVGKIFFFWKCNELNYNNFDVVEAAEVIRIQTLKTVNNQSVTAEEETDPFIHFWMNNMNENIVIINESKDDARLTDVAEAVKTRFWDKSLTKHCIGLHWHYTGLTV